MLQTVTNQNLTQPKAVLAQLKNDQFTHELGVLNHSTIGMHVRHILEFYLCLIKSVQSGVVNYDDRKRDFELETQISKSEGTIDRILDFVNELKEDVPLVLMANYSHDSSEEAYKVQTTLKRELLYNIEHTVHHLAIIKIGLNALNEKIECAEHFGVAASTVRNKKLCAQ